MGHRESSWGWGGWRLEGVHIIRRDAPVPFPLVQMQTGLSVREVQPGLQSPLPGQPGTPHSRHESREAPEMPVLGSRLRVTSLGEHPAVPRQLRHLSHTPRFPFRSGLSPGRQDVSLL